MREIIALSFLTCFSFWTVRLRSKKAIDNWATLILLVFSTVSSFLIVNYDVIHKLKYGDLEIEAVERQVAQIKEAAIRDLQQTVDAQKKSLGRIASTMIELSYVLADGASRFGGVPEPHRKQIDLFKQELAPYLEKGLDEQIDRTLKRLDEETLKWGEQQMEKRSKKKTTEQ